MKYEWLNKCENKNLIVFFNGWGMDSNAVSNLNFGNYDILIFYNNFIKFLVQNNISDKLFYLLFFI